MISSHEQIQIRKAFILRFFFLTNLQKEVIFCYQVFLNISGSRNTDSCCSKKCFGKKWGSDHLTALLSACVSIPAALGKMLPNSDAVQELMCQTLVLQVPPLLPGSLAQVPLLFTKETRFGYILLAQSSSRKDEYSSVRHHKAMRCSNIRKYYTLCLQTQRGPSKNIVRIWAEAMCSNYFKILLVTWIHIKSFISHWFCRSYNKLFSCILIPLSSLIYWASWIKPLGEQAVVGIF